MHVRNWLTLRRSARTHLPTTLREGRRLVLESLEQRRLLTLLGVTTTYPVATYDSTGVISYNPTNEAFDFTATPLTYRQSTSTPPYNVIDAVNGLQLHITVNNAGQLVQGASEHVRLERRRGYQPQRCPGVQRSWLFRSAPHR